MKTFSLKQRKYIGKIKQNIEDAILDGEIPNTYDAAFEYMMQIKDKIIEN